MRHFSKLLFHQRLKLALPVFLSSNCKTQTQQIRKFKVIKITFPQRKVQQDCFYGNGPAGIMVMWLLFRGKRKLQKWFSLKLMHMADQFNSTKTCTSKWESRRRRNRGTQPICSTQVIVFHSMSAAFLLTLKQSHTESEGLPCHDFAPHGWLVEAVHASCWSLLHYILGYRCSLIE